MKLYSAYVTVITTHIVIKAITSQEDSTNIKKEGSSSISSTINPILYTKYQSLFNTEASTKEYNYHQEDNSSSSSIWEEQLKFNWEEIKNSPHKNKLHPFILCYENEELTSRKRHEHILTHIHDKHEISSILPFRIKESETCYQLYSTLEQSKHISKKVNGHDDKVSMIPVSSAMKMFSGSVDTIEQIIADAYDGDDDNKHYAITSDGKKKKKKEHNPILVTLDSVLCPGVRSNKSDLRNNIKNQVLNHALDTANISNKLFWTHEKQSKKTKQGTMWEDVLSNTKNDQCSSIYKTAQFSFDEIEFHTMNDKKNDHKKTIMSKMSMVFPHDDYTITSTNENVMTSCLLRLMLSVTQLTDTCSLQVRPDYKPLNQYGQWLVQAGIEDTTPWYDVGLNGRDEVIALSDTGIDMTHCYFKDHEMEQDDFVFGGPDTLNLTRRKVVQYDNFKDESDYYHGHGTHVAGSIAGCRANGTGTSEGIASDAKIAFVDICKGDSAFLFVPEVNRLLGTGSPYAKIHSMSWGSTYNGYGYYAWEFDNYLQTDDELLLVIAAGNSGDNNNDQSVGDPSTLKNGIAVGSAHSYSTDLTDSMLGPGYISYYSSRGPTLDGRTKPDILAPGHYISSSAAGDGCDGQYPAEPGNKTKGLISYAGTSMATPLTAATAALVRQYLKEGYYPTGQANSNHTIDDPSASLIKAILLNGGQDMFGVDNGSDGICPVKPYDNIQNMGRISLIDSLYLKDKSNVQNHFWDRQTIEENVTLSYSKTINMTGGCNNVIFSAMLVWSDPPPAQSYCNECNINDLDLIVIKNDDPHYYYPNGYTSPDRNNNAERVRIDNIYDGDVLTINITGHTVFDLQHFSLVVSGCFGGSGNDIDMSDTVYQSEVTQSVDSFNVLTGVVQ